MKKYDAYQYGETLFKVGQVVDAEGEVTAIKQIVEEPCDSSTKPCSRKHIVLKFANGGDIEVRYFDECCILL